MLALIVALNDMLEELDCMKKCECENSVRLIIILKQKKS